MSRPTTPEANGGSLPYEIRPEESLVVVTYQAQPDFPSWAAAMEKVFQDERYQPGFGMLLDRRAITHTVDTEYMKRLVRYVEESGPRTGDARWALLVSGPAPFGMARMAEILSDSGRIRAFREIEEARDWLAA